MWTYSATADAYPRHSSKHVGPASAVRWNNIQYQLGDARADVLILLDCAYYPTHVPVRDQGTLEVIAASTGEDFVGPLGRGAFTRALDEQLRMRAVQTFKEPLSAAELHSKLVTMYPRMAKEPNPESEIVTRFPMPFRIQLSGTKTLPSILLGPLQHAPARPASPGGLQLSLTFRLADGTFNKDTWAEWLRLMPAGITDARVDGPYRNTL